MISLLVIIDDNRYPYLYACKGAKGRRNDSSSVTRPAACIRITCYPADVIAMACTTRTCGSLAATVC